MDQLQAQSSTCTHPSSAVHSICIRVLIVSIYRTTARRLCARSHQLSYGTSPNHYSSIIVAHVTLSLRFRINGFASAATESVKTMIRDNTDHLNLPNSSSIEAKSSLLEKKKKNWTRPLMSISTMTSSSSLMMSDVFVASW